MPRDPTDIDKLMALAKKSLVDDVSGRELLKAILQQFGGFAKLAELMKKEFDGLAAGHPSRLKMLMLIVSALFRFGDEGGITGDLEEAEKQLAIVLKQQSKA